MSATPEIAFGALYKPIWNAVVEVHAIWDVYRRLFVESSHDVALLNKTCGFAAWAIQRTIIDGIFICVCRLSEETGRGPKSKLTLKTLKRRVPADFRAAETADMQRVLDELDETTAAMREHRDNWIAHRNLQNAIAESSELPTVEKAEIERALALTAEFMEVIGRHYGQSPLVFKLEAAADGAANALAYWASIPDIAARR